MKSIVCETRYTWRATGFQIGTLSLPSKLKLYAEIQFKDKKKFNAFKDAFKNMLDGDKKGVTICDNSQANTINITWDYK